MQPDDLRAKYRAERDKRLRPEGNEQYIEPTGRFAHFLDDPYVPVTDRAPLTDDVTFAYVEGKPGAPSGAAWDEAVAQWRTLETDEGATFDREIVVDVEAPVSSVTVNFTV